MHRAYAGEHKSLVQCLPDAAAVLIKAFFLYGFPKSERSNINDRELLALKKQAKVLLSLSKEIIRSLLDDGVLVKIQAPENDNEKL